MGVPKKLRTAEAVKALGDLFTYPLNEGQISYTLSVEIIVGRTAIKTSLSVLKILVFSHYATRL